MTKKFDLNNFFEKKAKKTSILKFTEIITLKSCDISRS